MTDKQIITDNLGSEKCAHRAHLGYKDAPYYKKCYSCKLQNHQLSALQVNNTTEYWYECNTKNCLFKEIEELKKENKQLKRKEQELNKAKQIILQAVDDFSLEYSTPYYDKLLESAKSLGIEVKDYE